MPDHLFPWDAPSPAQRAGWFELEPFQPSFGLANPHVQTLWDAVRPGSRGVRFQRERIDTPDGDFLDIDIAHVRGHDLGDDAPVVMLLHGLEGSARRPYALETYRHLAAYGIRAVGMNYRSCSGEMNRTARFYHAGATDDVATAHDWLDGRFPGVAKGMIGVSLGGNMLLKYLGERREELEIRLRGAAAISPPFDLAMGSDNIIQSSARRYLPGFLRSLRAKVRAKEPMLNGQIDVPRTLAAATMRGFDEACTAPLHGFADADDYYARCSARRYLPGVRTPTLLLRAEDDPLIPASDIPHDLIALNPALTCGITAQGGHVGWIEGRFFAHRRWAERQAARFLAACLMPEH